MHNRCWRLRSVRACLLHRTLMLDRRVNYSTGTKCASVLMHINLQAHRLDNDTLWGCNQHPISAKGESKFDNIQISCLHGFCRRDHTRVIHTWSGNINKQPWRITTNPQLTACQLFSFACSMATVMPASVHMKFR